MNPLRQPSFIVKGELHAGIKGGITQHRVWKASNGALWAMSPPQARCFIVELTNYDYVAVPIKSITISTGDPREDIQIDGQGRPLHQLAVGESHQWALDALPSFVEIAHALHEDRLQKEESKNKKIEKKINKKISKQENKKEKKLNIIKTISSMTRKACASRWNKITRWLQKKTTPLRDEWLFQKSALKDFCEEWLEENPQRLVWLRNDRLWAGLSSIRGFVVNFIKKLPGFLFKVMLHAIRSAARGFWHGLKSPFDKFSPIRRKNFQAIIELQNGQTLKTRKSIGISLFFVEEKIMKLVFSPDELQRKEESSSKLLQALFDLLQIRHQPV